VTSSWFFLSTLFIWYIHNYTLYWLSLILLLYYWLCIPKNCFPFIVSILTLHFNTFYLFGRKMLGWKYFSLTQFCVLCITLQHMIASACECIILCSRMYIYILTFDCVMYCELNMTFVCIPWWWILVKPETHWHNITSNIRNIQHHELHHFWNKLSMICWFPINSLNFYEEMWGECIWMHMCNRTCSVLYQVSSSLEAPTPSLAPHGGRCPSDL